MSTGWGRLGSGLLSWRGTWDVTTVTHVVYTVFSRAHFVLYHWNGSHTATQRSDTSTAALHSRLGQVLV